MKSGTLLMNRRSDLQRVALELVLSQFKMLAEAARFKLLRPSARSRLKTRKKVMALRRWSSVKFVAKMFGTVEAIASQAKNLTLL